MCELNKKDEFINIKTTNKRGKKEYIRYVRIYWDLKETERKKPRELKHLIILRKRNKHRFYEYWWEKIE